MKKDSLHFCIFFLLILLSSGPLFSQSEISIMVDKYKYGDGWFDDASLVVEPHGSYVEESLYLSYDGLGTQWGHSAVGEVVHRFELPQGSVVNDLWVWIGNSVMKARCVDIWTGHSYGNMNDSKKYPAVLYKFGNMYELHVYPLPVFLKRRVKINLITPTKWLGNKAMVELPLSMLNFKFDSPRTSPLNIIFKSRQGQWGMPSIVEAPEMYVKGQKDTLGYSYMSLYMNNLRKYSSLKLSFDAKMENGLYYNSSKDNDSTVYFQAAFLLKDALKLMADSSAKKNLVGIDLSGRTNQDVSTFIPDIKRFVQASLKPNDQFNIMVSGAGRTKKLSPHWLSARPAAVDSLLENFSVSGFADTISYRMRQNLRFCDPWTYSSWSFPGIEQMAYTSTYENVYWATRNINGANVLAQLTHYGEDFNLPLTIVALDSFFAKGGRFVSLLEEINFSPPILAHYIKDFKLGFASSRDTYYRNPNGNIGMDFPEVFSVWNSGNHSFSSTDPEVKVELWDADGFPVVISKRIGKGLLVVSGISAFKKDKVEKLMVPLFGLQYKPVSPFMLDPLLNRIKDEYSKEKFDKVLLISNSDSLVQQTDAEVWAKNYSASFSGTKPLINSINLLNLNFTGSNSDSLIVEKVVYRGSGYMMKSITDEFKGLHIESNLKDMDIITSLLSPYYIPQLEDVKLSVLADGQAQKVSEWREVKQDPQYNNTPRFFIGSAENSKSLQFTLSAKISGSDSLMKAEYNMPVTNNSALFSQTAPIMLGYAKMQDLYALTPADTAQIARLGVKYNLLCDFTALIAFEPNDTIHFMTDPLDETQFITDVKEKQEADSLGLSVYPNPFNSMTRIKVSIRNASAVNIRIYNILGQLVNTIAENEEISASKIYTWDGRNNFGQTVSSGIYFTRVEISDKLSGKKNVFSRKLMLVK